MLLTKDTILKAADSKIEKLEVPEWGGHIFLKNMTGGERDAFVLVRCICDEEGNTVFTKKDIDALGKKSAKALDRCFAAAQKLNGLSAEDVEELTQD